MNYGGCLTYDRLIWEGFNTYETVLWTSDYLMCNKGTDKWRGLLEPFIYLVYCNSYFILLRLTTTVVYCTVQTRNVYSKLGLYNPTTSWGWAESKEDRFFLDPGN